MACAGKIEVLPLAEVQPMAELARATIPFQKPEADPAVLHPVEVLHLVPGP